MIALHTAGVSEMRILGSVFKISVVVALVVGALALFGRPWAYGESYRLEAEVAADFDVNKMEAGQFLELDDGEYTLFARDIDCAQGPQAGSCCLACADGCIMGVPETVFNRHCRPAEDCVIESAGSRCAAGHPFPAFIPLSQ